MKRRQLFEFGDLEWFPNVLRDAMTDFLRHAANVLDLYAPVSERLEELIARSSQPRIVDLASGAGGGWQRLGPRLREALPDLEIVLSDLFPNRESARYLVEAHPQLFHYEDRSVSALDVPPDLVGVRTQFLSFHHFAPDRAREILRNAVEQRAPIAIFEGQQRDWSHLLKLPLVPLNVLLLTPWIRPFRIRRLIFTYLLPILPPLIVWDGFVSILRTYDEDELREMIQEIDGHDTYDWSIGVESGRWGQLRIPYLIGSPKS